MKCSVIGGQFEQNIETTEYGYFSENNLPELAAEKNNEEQIKMCFEAYRSDDWKTLFEIWAYKHLSKKYPTKMQCMRNIDFCGNSSLRG